MRIKREFKNKILTMFKFIPDKIYLKLMYFIRIKKILNLDNPKTYNEKIQWLKLNDRKEEYSKIVDKYEVKNIVLNLIGEKYVIPTIGIYDNWNEIDFRKLPNKFVIKCTHDSGGLVICKDKTKLNLNKAKRKINRSLNTNFYLIGREWPYKNIKPRIIIEKYMEDKNEECLTDYKFFCFNGKPQLVYVSKDKSENPTTDFFDMNFSPVKIKMRDPNSEFLPSKPSKFDEMKKLAEILSKGYKHIRVDFYLINDEIYFGELTFYHNSGFSEVKPLEWNYKMGDMIELKGE